MILVDRKNSDAGKDEPAKNFSLSAPTPHLLRGSWPAAPTPVLTAVAHPTASPTAPLRHGLQQAQQAHHSLSEYTSARRRERNARRHRGPNDPQPLPDAPGVGPKSPAAAVRTQVARPLPRVQRVLQAGLEDGHPDVEPIARLHAAWGSSVSTGARPIMEGPCGDGRRRECKGARRQHAAHRPHMPHRLFCPWSPRTGREQGREHPPGGSRLPAGLSRRRG